jgi:integrase
MAIRTRNDNKKIFVDITINGKRRRLLSPHNKKSSAKIFESLIRGKVFRGEPVGREKVEKTKEVPIFKDFIPEWIKSYVKSNNRTSEYKNKTSVLKVHLIPYFGNIRLDKIGCHDIERFKNNQTTANLSDKTINNHLIVLSRILHIANEWGIIDRIPKIKKLRVTAKKIDYVSEGELQLLLVNSNGMLNDMILFATRTGLRFGEIIGLKWENVDFIKKEITVSNSISRGIEGPTKSGKIRYIPLIKEVADMLKNKQKPSGYVFSEDNGKFLAHTTYLSQIKKVCKKAGLRKIGWHTLRHSFASHLAQKGAPMIAIKELMGHSSITTTMIYAHLSKSTLIDSVKLLEKEDNVILGTLKARALSAINEVSIINKKCP